MPSDTIELARILSSSVVKTELQPTSVARATAPPVNIEPEAHYLFAAVEDRTNWDVTRPSDLIFGEQSIGLVWMIAAREIDERTAPGL